MPQTVFGQTDALALAVVGWINSIAATLCIAPSAERRFARKVNLPDIPKYGHPPSIDVFPSHEAIDRKSLATFESTYAVNLFIQQHVGSAPDVESQCSLLAQMHSQIMQKVRTNPFVMPNAVIPLPSNRLVFTGSKTGDRGLYNLERLESDNVFESDTILIFKAAA